MRRVDRKMNRIKKKRINNYIISEMLNNGRLERALEKWKNSPDSVEVMIELIGEFIERTRQDGGVIIGLQPNKMLARKNIELFKADKPLVIWWLDGKKSENIGRIAMAFTSKKKFEKCNDMAGIVLELRLFLEYIEKNNELDGIMINYKSEEFILDKPTIKLISKVIRDKKA